MTNALATTGKVAAPPIIADGPEALLSQAIAAGASIDTLERLMALRKEMLAEKGKEAFNAAMAAFQAECPVIEKTKEVKTNTGKVAYRYAPIESVVEQVKALLQKHGFRYSTTIEFDEEKGLVKAACHVFHEQGHEEVSIMPVPLGAATAIMSQTQRVAAASTFAKRYAFLNAFGIMTGDEDNDAAPSKAESSPVVLTPKQVKTVMKAPPPAAPSLIKVLESLNAAKTLGTLLTLHFNTYKYQWTENERKDIDHVLLGDIGKITNWTYEDSTFFDAQDAEMAKVVTQDGKLTVQILTPASK